MQEWVNILKSIIGITYKNSGTEILWSCQHMQKKLLLKKKILHGKSSENTRKLSVSVIFPLLVIKYPNKKQLKKKKDLFYFGFITAKIPWWPELAESDDIMWLVRKPRAMTAEAGSLEWYLYVYGFRTEHLRGTSLGTLFLLSTFLGCL